MHSELNPDPLLALESLDDYRRLFRDADVWRPYVQEICRRHALGPCERVRTGVPGTYPTFIVDERAVVKYFGRLFDGGTAFEAEREAARLIAQDPAIPAPPVIASGQLLDKGKRWPWPYLVFAYVAGSSIGEAFGRLSFDDRLEMARRMAGITRRLHALPLAGSPVFVPSWDLFTEFLRAQRHGCAARHRQWASLPAHLVEQIDAYLLPAEALVDRGAVPHLIHADLTADHVLGSLDGGHWTTAALIDFGDARVGNLLYELCALHLDLFDGDRRLLAAYLDAYGLDEAARRALPRRAMSVALLHQFDVLLKPRERALRAATLDELAALLWGAAQV